jgi:signal transduction histidine kinase/ActR/RegA family two-component response regulator
MTSGAVPGSPSFGADWTIPLNQFADSTGLTVSVFDSRLEMIAGPYAPAPFAQRLVRAGLWEKGKAGVESDAALAGAAMSSKHISYGAPLDTLTGFAIPLRIDGQIGGAIVAGWVFDHFADPIESDRIARRIGVAPSEIWQLVRQQPPVVRDKLAVYAGLLLTLTDALLTEQAKGAFEREAARVLQILYESASKMAGTSRVEDIGAAAVDAAMELAEAAHVRLLTKDPEGAMVVAAERGNARQDQADIERMGTLRIPIASAGGAVYGAIEVTRAHQFPGTAVEAPLSTLAAQVAVALQKAQLVSDLEQEHARLERALNTVQVASRLKDEFLATMSHELRTPLNAMLGWVRMLRGGKLEESKRERALETIERNAVVQTRLIDDLLDASRIIAGKLQPDMRPMDLIKVVEAGIDAVRPAAEAKAVHIETDFVSPAIPFIGDADRIQQIVWNLMSNAVKFTPSAGKVTVKVTRSKALLEILVSDSGAGMPASFLPHVFDRFSQADASPRREHGGLGLGLAIVRHLVELHGGTVTATSEGAGLGSTFVVRFPDVVAKPIGSKMATIASDGVRLDDLRILVVDDDPDGRHLLASLLEAEGATVRAVESAALAFAAVKEWRPHVIAADFAMPREDGNSLIQRIRSLSREEGGSTPAVAVTAYNRAQDRDAALASGFQAHFSKPFKASELIQAIANLAAGDTRRY